MARTKAQEKARQEAIEQLRAVMPAGTVVYTVLRHVSQSGDSRAISVHLIRPDSRQYRHGDGWITVEEPSIWDCSYLVARALDYRRDERHGGLKVEGGGMDMGFHLVNSLSYALHGMDTRTDGHRAGYTLTHRSI